MLFPSVRKRLFGCNDFILARRQEMVLLLNTKYECDYQIFRHYEWEEEAQLSFLMERARQLKCDMFLDIGANIGIYAIAAALRTDAETIYAFEPDQHNYDRLRTNILLNNVTHKIKTHMIAVSDHDGEVPFNFAPSWKHVLSMVDKNSSTRVPSITLDSFLDATNRRIALKIDIEGHESEALDGMKGILTANQCFLQVECWSQNADAFIAKIDALGYKVENRIGKHDYYFVKK